MTAHELAVGFTISVLAFALVVVVLLVQNGLVAVMDRIDRRRRRDLERDAVLFGEPTREQAEADVDADAAWAAVLAAVNATTDDVRTAYAARQTTHP